MRPFLKKRQPDHQGLVCGETIDRGGDPRSIFGAGYDDVGGFRKSWFVIPLDLLLELSSPRGASYGIDAQITRDGENPCRRACCSWIELRCFTPNCDHRALGDLFGFLGRASGPEKKALYARRKMLEQ